MSAPAASAMQSVVGPTDGRYHQIGGLGVRFIAETDDASIVEHPLAPRSLGAPVHTHAHEDEYSYVTEGRVSVEIGGNVVEAGPGEMVLKPRGIPHAFWNAADEPARIIEVIAPGGFARYFDEIAPLFAVDGPPQVDKIPAIAARYGMTIDFGSVERIARENGLTGLPG